MKDRLSPEQKTYEYGDFSPGEIVWTMIGSRVGQLQITSITEQTPRALHDKFPRIHAISVFADNPHVYRRFPHQLAKSKKELCFAVFGPPEEYE